MGNDVAKWSPRWELLRDESTNVGQASQYQLVWRRSGHWGVGSIFFSLSFIKQLEAVHLVQLVSNGIVVGKEMACKGWEMVCGVISIRSKRGFDIYSL